MTKEEAVNESDLEDGGEGNLDEVESVMGTARMPQMTLKEKACRLATAISVAIAGVAGYNSIGASTPPLSYLQ